MRIELNTHCVERAIRAAIWGTKENRILSSLNAFEFKGLTDKMWTHALLISFHSGVDYNIHGPQETSLCHTPWQFGFAVLSRPLNLG